MWLCILSLCCWLGAATAPALDDPVPLDPVADRMAAARAAYAGGALGEAYDQLRIAFELSPEEPGVRLWLGIVLNDLGRGEQALEVLEPARAAEPRSAWVQLECGRAQRALGRTSEAERTFRAALDAYPELVRARLLLVQVLIDQGAARAEEALGSLQPLLEARPVLASAVLREAEVLTLLGREAEAEACLRGAVADPAVRLALCRRLAADHRTAEAWEVGSPLVGETNDVGGRTLLAQVARRAGEPLTALQLLGAVLLEDPTDETALAELTELLEDADDLAERVVSRRLASKPGDADTWRELFEDCLRDGNPAAVLARFEAVPEALRSDPRLVVLRGQALRRANRAAEARALLEPLSAAGDARACYEVGLLDYAAEHYEEAAAEFARGAAGSWAADACFNRGICLDRLGKYAEAADEYAAAAAARPDFAEAWLQLGHDCRLRLGQPRRAREAYRRYLDLGGDDAEVRRYVESEP